MLLVLSVPALVRTVSVARREKRHGQRITAGGKIGHFFLSLLSMYGVCAAASTAFTVAAMGTCFAAIATSSASEEAAMGVGIVGLILSLAIAAGGRGGHRVSDGPKRD
jgi:cytochrome bd-type quinol oxidase subunit 2